MTGQVRGPAALQAKPNLNVSLIFRRLGLMAPPPRDPYLGKTAITNGPAFHGDDSWRQRPDRPYHGIREFDGNYVSPCPKSLGPLWWVWFARQTNAPTFRLVFVSRIR